MQDLPVEQIMGTDMIDGIQTLCSTSLCGCACGCAGLIAVGDASRDSVVGRRSDVEIVLVLALNVGATVSDRH